MSIRSLQLGAFGEQLACDYLVAKSYVILARNSRIKRTEIDIIARHKDTLVFCEVKTRSSHHHGLPIEAVTRAKLTNMQTAALEWLSFNRVRHGGIRFDVIGILMRPDSSHDLTHLVGVQL